MKLIFVLMLLGFSLSSFATDFEGRGEDTDNGIERCDLKVKKTGKGKLEVQVFTLGEVFKFKINEDASDFKIRTLGMQVPKSDIVAKGVFENGRPVSMEVSAKQKLEGMVFEDRINCSFE